MPRPPSRGGCHPDWGHTCPSLHIPLSRHPHYGCAELPAFEIYLQMQSNNVSSLVWLPLLSAVFVSFHDGSKEAEICPVTLCRFLRLEHPSGQGSILLWVDIWVAVVWSGMLFYVSPVPGHALQWRRTELQAVGCRAGTRRHFSDF